MNEPIEIHVRQKELLSKLEIRITSKKDIKKLVEFSMIIIEIAECFGGRVIQDEVLEDMKPNTIACVVLFETSSKAMSFARILEEYC